VHTSLLRTEAFRVEVDGRPATIDEVFPSWEPNDRVGVVMFSPLGAVGASLLLQLAIARFYEERRAAGMREQMVNVPGFLSYADHYLFHVGGRHGDFSVLDFVPANKEVFVDGAGDELLTSINDRAITRLLIEERPPADPDLEPSAVDSALRRVRSTLVYARTGGAAGADVRVTGIDDVAEANVRQLLDPELALAAYAGQNDPRIVEAMRLLRCRMAEVSPDIRAMVASERSNASTGGSAVEGYRRVGMEEALGILAERSV
jgi:hypothetical protein